MEVFLWVTIHDWSGLACCAIGVAEVGALDGARTWSCGSEPADGDDVTGTPETIKSIVHSAITALNEELPQGDRLELKGATRLVGPRGALNSLQIVNLVIQLEEEIAERLGVELELTVNEELFNEDGPLRTVDTLMAYLSKALAADRG
jgi:hypothetical protein